MVLLAFFFAAASSDAQSYCLRWVQRTDVGSCGDRAGHSLAYDTHRNVTVFFGGDIPGGSYFNETWEYDGTLWRRITIDGPAPPARAMASMAYDEVARYVVLAGGETSGGLLKDTWIYHSTTPGRGTWEYAGDMPTAFGLPAERAGASLTFDANSQKLVMTGGATFKNGDEYTHAVVMLWNREAGWGAYPGGGSLPALGFKPTFARNGLARHFAAFDTDQNWLLFHGGWQGCYTEGICDPDDDPNENPYYVGLKDGEIKVVVGSTPSTDKGLQQGAMVYDSNRRRLVNFGGFNVGEFGSQPVPGHRELAFTGNANLPYAKLNNAGPIQGLAFPSARTRNAMVYDRARKRTVLYGGANGQINFADTWELVALDPIRLQTPPTSHTACEGTAYQLGASFQDPPPGYEPHTFRWLKNGAVIPGATSSLLSFPALTPDDAGQYQYVITTPCGHSVTQSPPTALSIKLVPRLAAFDPSRRDRCPGESVTLSVSATGDAPLRYQWRKNAQAGSAWTNATLTLANLQHADTGDYDVLVFNSCQTVTSPVAHVQVGVTISTHPQSISPDVCGSGLMSVMADGVGTLRYQWRLDGVPITGLLRENMRGVNSANLALAPVIYAHDGKYDVVITDDCGPTHAVTSSVARLTVKPGPQWWLRATNGPPPRFGHTMVYDSARRVTVMFGGQPSWGGLACLNDLWEWDGARWTERMPSSASNGWTFTNFSWRVSHADRPVQRLHHTMAYDSRRGRVVLFGGRSIGPNVTSANLKDLWEWDGTRWHFRATNGPVARAHGSMAYDERRGRTVLFGGQPVPAVGEVGDGEIIWEWDGDRWHTNRPPANPSDSNFRAQSRMAYDSFRGVIVFGPTTESYSHWAFWDWDGVKWTNFPVLHFTDPVVTVLHGTSLGGFDFDENRRRSTWFGGLQLATVNYTTLFDGKDWTLLANSTPPPASRVLPAMAYDSDRRAHVMFGGSPSYGSGGGTNDTWELIAVDKPLINEQPASQYRPTNSTAILRVQAVGPGQLTYQWYHGDVLLPGENADTLSLPNLDATDAGEYHVLVSNDCGTRASHTAVLTLDPKLQVFSAANTTTLVWSPASNLVLQSAEVATGPWAPVPNATNPFAVGTAGPAKFFRLREPE